MPMIPVVVQSTGGYLYLSNTETELNWALKWSILDGHKLKELNEKVWEQRTSIQNAILEKR